MWYWFIGIVLEFSKWLNYTRILYGVTPLPCSKVYVMSAKKNHKNSTCHAFNGAIECSFIELWKKMDHFIVEVPFSDMDLISAWLNTHIHSKVWNDITYPCQSSTLQPLKLELTSNFITHSIGYVLYYLCWKLSITVKEAPALHCFYLLPVAPFTNMV